ncbi:MAG: 5-(carboxyamino)imidazole ribonucleotide synthase [Leptolyngbya sp.]|nr:5-(carboxyamino)imidazole ribonucleotide synthase [Leptolyngbya sp.]
MARSQSPTDQQSPIQRVGIIGGGQLAWMMAPGAKALGLELVVQTPSPQDPAVAIAADSLIAPVADGAATAQLAQRCDVISFENEFIDLAALAALPPETFRPSLRAIAPLLDKGTQRQCFAQIGLPNPNLAFLGSQTDLASAKVLAQQVGWPLVMKTCRLGYDGKGTFILQTWADLVETWERLGQVPVVLEAFIPFEKELAIMVARSAQGEVVTYPTVETQQIDQVCRRVIAPAQISPAVAEQAAALATILVNALDYVGVMGIELFLAPGDRLLVNEVAPRTHNSGHYTLDACETSQFEQQLRAISDRPLGSTAMTCDCAVMVNLLGFETADHGYPDARSRLAAIPQAQVYWYGKAAARPGRKLGHVTLCLDGAQAADLPGLVQAVEALWYPQ